MLDNLHIEFSSVHRCWPPPTTTVQQHVLALMYASDFFSLSSRRRVWLEVVRSSPSYCEELAGFKGGGTPEDERHPQKLRHPHLLNCSRGSEGAGDVATQLMLTMTIRRTTSVAPVAQVRQAPPEEGACLGCRIRIFQTLRV